MIGGWREGTGGRTSRIGALMLGIPEGDGLHFAGRVGTGFTDKALTKLRETLKPLETDESPFNTRLPTQDRKGVTFVRPELVGEVRYSERTTDGRLRQPSWRGLRPDKSPDEVVLGVTAPAHISAPGIKVTLTDSAPRPTRSRPARNSCRGS